MVLSFSQYLTESKNKHLEHLEDLIILNGANGGREAIEFLRSLRDMLAGHSKNDVSVTVKWDGAPAIIAGINPQNGQFFVGTKGVFADKNPKINYTEADIDKNHGSGGLADKLKAALKYLPELEFDGIFQGDFLFTKEDIKVTVMDGQKYIVFQPNTIIYAVPMDSPLAHEILKHKFGIVVHTRYTGKTIADSKASFNLKASEFKKSSNVWLKDAEYKDVTGKATFDEQETKEITSIISKIGSTFNKIDGKVLKALNENEELKILLLTFNNSKVRSGTKVTNTAAHTKEFVSWVQAKYQKQIDKLKKDDAKAKRQKIVDDVEKFVTAHASDFKNIFDLQNLVVDAKSMLLGKLNQVQGIHTFVQTPTGYKVTNPEGFVVTDHIGNVRKLVDRLEFSFNNFNAIKNWG